MADPNDRPTLLPRSPPLEAGEKRELILQTDRPPQLETPLRYFRQDFTPKRSIFCAMARGRYSDTR